MYGLPNERRAVMGTAILTVTKSSWSRFFSSFAFHFTNLASSVSGLQTFAGNMNFFGFGSSNEGPEYQVVEISEDEALEAELSDHQPVLRKDVVGVVYGKRRWTELAIAFMAGVLTVSLMHSVNRPQKFSVQPNSLHAATSDSMPPALEDLSKFHSAGVVDDDYAEDGSDGVEDAFDDGFQVEADEPNSNGQTVSDTKDKDEGFSSGGGGDDQDDGDGSDLEFQDEDGTDDATFESTLNDGGEGDNFTDDDADLEFADDGGADDGSDLEFEDDGGAEDGASVQADSPPILEKASDLPLGVRLKFQRDFKEHNITWLHEPKPTPSGWWPDAEWIMDCVERERDLKPFDTLIEFKNYRLGDCVKLCSGCPTDQEFKNLAHWTIAGQYYDSGCDANGPHFHTKRGNETLLLEILKNVAETQDYPTPDPEAIVIHLRLGDKMESSKSNPFTMLHFSADPGRKSFQGVHAIKSVYEFLSDIIISEAPKVVIRGGSQWPDEYKKSKTYAYCLAEAIEKAGYEVEMNLSEGNPDRDFFYMVNARKMIPSVGGFSRFIAHMVLETGGIVYGRVFRR